MQQSCWMSEISSEAGLSTAIDVSLLDNYQRDFILQLHELQRDYGRIRSYRNIKLSQRSLFKPHGNTRLSPGSGFDPKKLIGAPYRGTTSGTNSRPQLRSWPETAQLP